MREKIISVAFEKKEQKGAKSILIANVKNEHTSSINNNPSLNCNFINI